MHELIMPATGTAQVWRDTARKLLAANVPPADVIWNDEAALPGLWPSHPAPEKGDRRAVNVPRSFIAMSESVVWHSNPERFGLLYRFLWRLRANPRLMSDQADADLAALRRMEKNVHRCQHKMKAFLRFRDIGAPGDARRSFAAWFEPTHHTIEQTVPFFARRFGDMDWRIITPDVTAAFINGKITFSAGQNKPPLPDDACEQLWVTYFRNIFNPARLKMKAMQSEMPKKYWRNLPEAAAIPELVATAPERVRRMAIAAPTMPPRRAPKIQNQIAAFQTAWTAPSDDRRAAMATCKRSERHVKMSDDNADGTDWGS